ncbi:hypothetical protein PENTCL1PPCAC_22805 [Pristionchus entomophagus]|uniref:PHD finger motif containing protein n=1 Tax=Pristionchus entomophagus TaxID=358040 RepID=A0AAV5U188_9BILA|nr:hypothetical protein PENTCL1PPCAC_22805 [Pristionchus entomophagus]
MSYEAVPCMVRAPSQDGTKGAILGVIIRPSSSQEGSHGSSLQTPPGVIPIKGAKSIVIQPGSKRSLIISNDQIQKMVNGRGMKMSPHSLWSPSHPLPSSSTSSSLLQVSQSSSLTSPQSVDGSSSSPSSSIRIHSSVDGIASSTPDSGIQSVPPTPPQTCSHQQKGEEKAEDESKWDDMPRLRPMDEEDMAICGSSVHPSVYPPPLDDSLWSSECETSLPSSLINTSWNPEEIATQLLSMAAFDPQKIQEVTALMLQRSKEDVGKKEENKKKRKNEKTESIIGKKKAKIDYEECKPSTSSEESGERNDNRDMSEEEHKRSEEEPRDEEERDDTLTIYRLAIRRRLNNKVEETTDRVVDSLSHLSLGEQQWKKRDVITNPLFRPIQWTTINERKVNLSDILRRESREKNKKEEDEVIPSIVQRKKRKEERKKESKEPIKKLKRRGEKEEETYENIQSNEYVCSHPLPSLSSLSSTLSCECTRGGCLSPSQCIHRSLRLFCTPSTCPLHSCSNRLSSSYNLYLSKGILKTKEPKKANEFMGEIVGEVVSVSSMASRISSSASPLRSFAFTPTHFIDCSSKGNITRFIRHSCQPNSSIQIWWELGVPHLCIFSLYPIASNSEITVDLSFISPSPFDCHCSSRKCRLSIPPSISIYRYQSMILPSTISFLRRNLRESGRRKRDSNRLLYSIYLLLDHKLRYIDGKVNREYASILYKLRCASISDEKELFKCLISELMNITQDPIDTHSLSCIRNRLMIGKEEEEKEKKKSRKSDSNAFSRHIDTSYLDESPPVGSYNPDEWKGGEICTNDAVRCICGVLEDDGEMVECDKCHYWLHSDCIDTPSTQSFQCPLCLSSTSSPNGDVILKIQPQIRLDGCTYFKALENNKKIQIRLNECVYVKRLQSDNYKKILRALEQKKGKINDSIKEESLMCQDLEDTVVPPRSSLRVFRVERLLVTDGGYRFLFGSYFARPHETYVENRLFHKSEIFATPLYDTLPLDAVVGKCIVLSPVHFCGGRPVGFQEQDVLVCEYQLDRNQRHFDKCRNNYYLNTEPYAFKKFERARTLQRCFTPFTYSSSSTPSATITCSQDSQEETARLLRQQSAKRINTVVKRLTSTHV